MFAKAGVGVFGNAIVKPFINAFMKSKDVDLEKFKISTSGGVSLAGEMLKANVAHGQTKSNYAIKVLQWWPFRLILFVLLAVSAFHYVQIILDSSPFRIPLFMSEAHVVGSWGVPKPPAPYDAYERDFLLFFIIAKPVELAVTSVLQTITAYLQRP